MKYVIIVFFLLPLICQAQHIFTADFQNFLTMRDSVLATEDTATQMDFVRKLYIDKASDGLKAFMRNKDNLDRKWLELIKSQPAFWDSLRSKTKLVSRAAVSLEREISRFRAIYPELAPAQTYFLVGIRQQGGTIRGNLSLLGVEVILGNPEMDEHQLVRMGLHEYIHTQQKRPDFQKINVLTSSVREGACDFLSFIISGIPVKTAYMSYGLAHQKAVWSAFQKEMYTDHNDNWVSTGNNPALPAPDLGYFVGYQISKAYYDKAPDKKAAIKRLIEINYADAQAVDDFYKGTGYNGE